MKKISSLLVVVLLMLASFTAGVEYQRGDVNQDGNVSISDVTCLINYLLSGTWGDEPVTPPDEHEWVDLGLPSGTLWATCNVGANAPEEYGNYYAWGETETKYVYTWETYKWCNGSDSTLTKYCTKSDFGYNGFTDGKTELDPEDDAAYVNWGASWRMPNLSQMLELIGNCTWTWTTQNGVNGQLVTGPNGNTMFLPAVGIRLDERLVGAGNTGDYWMRTSNDSNRPYLVTDLNIFYGGLYWSSGIRYYGFAVRPVRVSQN